MLKSKKKSKESFAPYLQGYENVNLFWWLFENRSWTVSGKIFFFAQAYKVEGKTVEDCHHTGRNDSRGFISNVLIFFHFYYMVFYILKVFIPGVGASWSLSVYDSLSA